MSTCTTMSEDIAKLESWATVLQEPIKETVQHNVQSNILKLTRDVTKLRSSWKNEKYYEFGTTLGNMVVILTQPVTMAF